MVTFGYGAGSRHIGAETIDGDSNDDRCVRTPVVPWKSAKTPGEVAALRAARVDGVTADRWDLV